MRIARQKKKLIAFVVAVSIISQPVLASATTTIVAPNVMVLMANSSSMGNMLTNDTTVASDPSVYDTTTMSYPNGTENVIGPYAAGNAPTSKLYQAKQVMQSFFSPGNTLTQNINFGFATYRMIYGVPEYLQQQSGVSMGNGTEANATYYNSALVPDNVTQADNNSSSQLAPYANDPANFFAESNVAIPATTRPSWCSTLPDASPYYAVVGKGICDTNSGLVSVTNICTPLSWTDSYGGTWTVTPSNCTNPASTFFTPYSDPYPGAPGGIPITLAGNPVTSPTYAGYNYLFKTSYSSQGSGQYRAYYSGDQMLINIINGSVTGGIGQPPAASTGGMLTVTTSQVDSMQTSDMKATDFTLYPPGATTETAAPAGSIYFAANRIPSRTISYTGSSSAGNFTVQPFSFNVAAGYLPHYYFNSTTTSVVGNLFASPADEDGRPGSVSWTSTNTPYSSNVNLGNVSEGYAYPVDIGNLLGWSGETEYSCYVNGVLSTNGGCLNVTGTTAWSVSYPSTTTATVTAQSAGGVSQVWSASYPAYTPDPDGRNRNLVSDGFSVNTGASGMENWFDTRSGSTQTRVSENSHMGIFLDLPSPVSGYVDQRSLINGFLGFQQMRNDGDDYYPQGCGICNASGMMPYTEQGNSNPLSIPVSGYYGVSISSYNFSIGSELYDSLQDSYAYYAAYKQQDPYNNCRSNNLLLVIDGKEDARYIGSSVTHVVDPVPVAAALHQNLGINVYVVIMSSETGDISQANAIAQAGGTGYAYQATNTTALFSALSSIFTNLVNQVNATPVAAPSALVNGTGYVYDTLDSISPSQGHVDAYSVSATGAVSSTPSWDAENAETISARTDGLYSTGVSTTTSAGPITLLTNLDAAAFALNAADASSQTTIVDYTINPSYPCTTSCTAAGSPYLGGRAPNSYFGVIGNLNQLAAEQFAQPLQLLNPPNDATLITNNSYTTWATTESNRPSQLLFPDQDGFLYSVYQNGQPTSNPTPSGQLAWGWMPREFVANLQQNLSGSDSFVNNHYGDGAEIAVDAQNTGGQWATYIVGNMYDTQTNYDVGLNSVGVVSSVVYDDYRPQSTTTSLPRFTQPSYFRLQNGSQNTTYVVYVTTNAAQQPVVVVREVTTGQEVFPEMVLPFTPTSNYFILNGVMYLGDGSGNVYDVPLTSGTVLSSSLVLNTVGSFYDPSYATDADHAVAYVGGIMEGGAAYIYAASSTRITVFGQTQSSGSFVWEPLWTSYTGGAGEWTNGAYVPSTAGVITEAPVSGIQFLPLNALITDNPSIANNALVVPVTTTVTNSCSPGSAYYYLYNLLNGNFPGGVFSTSSGPVSTPVTTNIFVGQGTAYSVSGSSSSSAIILFGSSSINGNQISGNVGGQNILSFSTSGPGNQFVWWQVIKN